MGQSCTHNPTVNMKAFVCMSLLAYAAAAPAAQVLVGHAPVHAVHAVHAPVHHAVVGGQASHQSVSTAHGEVRTLSQSKAFVRLEIKELFWLRKTDGVNMSLKVKVLGCVENGP